MLAIAVLYVCFTGTMFLGSFILTRNPYPFFIAGARFFASGVILLALYAARHKRVILQQLPQLMCAPLFKYAFCLYTLSAIGFSWGMQYVDPVKACFVFVLTPFITALQLYYLKGEVLSSKKIVGLMVGFAAVVPIIFESAHGSFQDIPWHMTMLGYGVFGCAVITYSYGWILNQEMHAILHLPSLLVTGIALVIGGGTTLLLYAIACAGDIPVMYVTEGFWWLLLLFAILTAIAYNLYSSLLKRYSATFIAFASFLEPAFGLCYGALFLAQPISTTSCISLAILGCGLYIFYQEELRLQ